MIERMTRFAIATGIAFSAMAGPGIVTAQRAITPVTDAMLGSPAPADWLMWRRTLNSWGYSPLDQINTANVRQLAMVWSRPLAPGIQEGTPLVHDGVMFMPNPLDVVQAIDAATGDLLWEYRRTLPEDIGKSVPFPAINRNVAIYGNAIIQSLVATGGRLLFGGDAQGRFRALDQDTGKVLWEVNLGSQVTTANNLFVFALPGN